MAGEFVERTSVESFSAKGSETRPLETINPNAPAEPEGTTPEAAPEAPSQEPISLNTPLDDPRMEAMRLGLLRDYTGKTMGASEQRLKIQQRAQELEEMQRNLEAQAQTLAQHESMLRLGQSVTRDPELAQAVYERIGSQPAAPSTQQDSPLINREVAELRRGFAELQLDQAFTSIRGKYPDFSQRESDVVGYVIDNGLLAPGMKAPQIQKILEGAHALLTRDTRNAAADAAAQRKLVDQAQAASAVRTVPGGQAPAPAQEPSSRRSDGTLKDWDEMAQELKH